RAFLSAVRYSPSFTTLVRISSYCPTLSYCPIQAISASTPPKDVHTNCSLPVKRFTSAATSCAQATASLVMLGNAVAVRITVIMGHLPPTLRLQLLTQRLRLSSRLTLLTLLRRYGADRLTMTR